LSGPRVTSGEDSKQDYQTPADLMAAVAGRFGPVQFDLAAHAGNTQHARYFAPTEFVTEGTLEDVEQTPGEGQIVQLFTNSKKTKPKLNKKKQCLYEKHVPNVDPAAYALDAFAHAWAPLSVKFGAPDGGRGLLWLNCEFGDVTPWSERCLKEMRDGANVVLLTPAVMANWFRDHIAGRADTYFLSGRVCFDGKNVFPKDCMVSHFHPGARGRVALWDWKKDEFVTSGLWLPADARKDLEAA